MAENDGHGRGESEPVAERIRENWLAWFVFILAILGPGSVTAYYLLSHFIEVVF